MIPDVAGRCAVVTGGGGLLGAAMARAFAAAGMDVVVADLDVDAAARVASELRGGGGRATSVQVDVADLASVTALADAAYAEYGAIHLLCNNAGVNVIRPVLELTAQDWDKVLSVNLGGVVNGLLAFLPRLAAQDGPRHVVNTASMSGAGLGRLRPQHVPYVASKHAIVGLSEALAEALAPDGIGVSVLCPGFVSRGNETRFAAPSAEWYRDDMIEPERVAHLLLDAVRAGRLHVFTQEAGRRELLERYASLLEGFEGVTPPAPG